MTTFDHRAICAQFAVLGDFVGAEPYGSGHINDTQLVTYDQAGLTVRYILQRINHAIFPRPDLLMENICRVTEHLRRQAPAHPSQTTLTVIPARDGRPWVRDADGNWFRMYLFIEHARSYDILETPRQAFEAARAFGAFQCHLADLPGPRLHETIANFHHTPSRFQALRQAIAADACGRLAAAQPEVDFILARERDYSLLVDLQAEGRLHERITHNDTKLNNVLLDDADGTGRAVIDLDTVMPGLPHYDFGDMVRTGTSPAAEDERDLSKVTMRFEMFEALTSAIKEEIVRRLFSFRLKTDAEVKRQRVAKVTGEGGGGDHTVKRQPVVKKIKVGPNDPCPCGSGKKYKKCCRDKDLAAERGQNNA